MPASRQEPAMFLKVVIFLGLLGLICGKDEVPVPKATSVSQTPGLRTHPDLTYTVTCEAVNSTNNGTMTLVAVSARGNVVAGTSQSVIPSGETLYTTTLKANVTVMSHDTDTYVCNIVYADKSKTAKNSTVISLVNKGTGVDLTLPSTPGENGKTMKFTAKFDQSVMNPEDQPKSVRWTHNGDLMATYDKEAGTKVAPEFKDKVKFTGDPSFATSEIELTVSYCDENVIIACYLMSVQSQVGGDSGTLKLEPVLPAPVILPTYQNISVVVDKPFNFTFQCKVTGSSAKPTMSVSTTQQHSSPTSSSVLNNNTCLYESTIKSDISVSANKEFTDIRCIANYTTEKQKPVDTARLEIDNTFAYSSPVITPVSQGFRTEDNWSFEFKCKVYNTTVPAYIKLIAQNATGNHTDPQQETSYQPGSNNIETTLTTYMTVFPAKCDIYRCDAFYNTTNHTESGPPHTFCSNGSGVTVNQTSGSMDPGHPACFEAMIDTERLEKGQDVSQVTWLMDNETIATYKVSTKKCTVDPKYQTANPTCDMDAELHNAFLNITTSNCYRDKRVTSSVMFSDMKVGAGKTQFQGNDITKYPAQVPHIYKVVENKTWNFLFECDVFNVTGLTNITLITKDKYQTQEKFVPSFDNKTCISNGTLTANVTLPYGVCATYQCKAAYESGHSPTDDPEQYCNKITYPKPVADPRTSKLRTTDVWSFTFTCSALQTQVGGNLTVVAGKDNKGNHTDDNPSSAQNDTTKLWDNTLMSEVNVPMGDDGKPQCDTYSCSIIYENTTTEVQGDPVQYCNNGTGVTVEQMNGTVNVGDTAELIASFNDQMITPEDPVAVQWYYGSELIYIYKSSGANKTSGDHGKQIKHVDTDLKSYSHLYFDVTSCDIDTASLSCHLSTNKHTGVGTKSLEINRNFNKAVQKKPPDHKVTANKPWTFTFECDVTDATQEANITLDTKSNHTKPEVTEGHNATTCLYSTKLTTNVTVAYNACVAFSCDAVYADKTVKGDSQSYCNKIAYPKAVAQPEESPILRTTADWTFHFMCNTTARSQMNATITLVAVTAKGKHTGDNSTSIPNKDGFYTNTLTSTVTVPAGNGTFQCDTYRCDVTYKDGNKTTGTAQAYCNNGTGVEISQSPDLVEINDVVDFNASFVTLGDLDEVTWYYNEEVIYKFNKSGKENTTFGHHKIVDYNTDSQFKFSFIDLNVSACDVGNYVMCELKTKDNMAGNFTKLFEIKPVLTAPVMMKTPNHTAVEAQVWNFTFYCSVEGSTEAPNITLSGSHHSTVVSTHKYDNDTCLYSGYLSTNVSLSYGTCVDYTCKAIYLNGTVSSTKTTYCNGASNEKKLKRWQLALIVIAAIVVVAAIVSAVVYVVRKKRRAASGGEHERLINDPTAS